MKLILTFITLFTIQTLYAQNTIIGGNAISIEEAPYQVQIYSWSQIPGSPGIIFRGSGYIIADKWILTAAHILEALYNPTGQAPFESRFNLLLKIGDSQRTSANSIVPLDIHIHPSFIPKQVDSDIALIELTNPIVFDHKQQPVEFANSYNTQAFDYKPGQLAFFSGWGALSQSTVNTPSTFLSGTTCSLIDNATADAIFLTTTQPNGSLTSNMIAFLDGVSTSYHYDSGSPAVIDKNGNKISLGTCSWTYRHPSVNPLTMPIVYTNIKAFENWIYSITGIALPSNTLDLYTKDKPWDQGEEPFTTPDAWTSEDIWVRNTNDGIEIHQDPEYKMNSSNYVYVRVTNNSAVPSTGNEVLTLNWAKAATNLTWPFNWDGSISAGTQPLGGLVGTASLPVIQPGDAYIAEIPWNPVSPTLFSTLYTNYPSLFLNDEPHHFCLLSRIESTTDPIINETSSVYANTLNNNNIAWKNVTIVNNNLNDLTGGNGGSVDDRPVGANVIVGGIGNENEDFNLLFQDLPNAGEEFITDFAEVKITLDDELWSLWENAGFSSTGIEIINEEKNQILISEKVASINNLIFSDFNNYILHTSFNFLTDEIDEEKKFHYTIFQEKSNDNSIVGGETYEVYSPDRINFDADAGDDIEITTEDSVTISADPISELAIYNWYDENGNLLHTGIDFTISTEISTIFMLEVIAIEDGFKDYDEVEITINENYIENFSPNPAESYLNIDYHIETAQSSFLVMLNLQTNASNQYLIDPLFNSTQLNTSSLQSGNYVLLLFVDGVVQDSKNIIVQ